MKIQTLIVTVKPIKLTVVLIITVRKARPVSC